MRNGLVASGGGRGSGTLAGCCGQKRLGTRQRERVSVDARLNAAKHTLITDGREAELWFVLGSSVRYGNKQNALVAIVQTG